MNGINACPRCQAPLGDDRLGSVRVYPCAACGGLALTVSQLRRLADKETFYPFWAAIRSAPPALLACPSCDRPMSAADVSGVEVDGCVRCTVIWLDAGEQEQLFSLPPPTPKATQVADQLIAREQVAATRQRRRQQDALDTTQRLLELLLWWAW